jgi:putative transposase
MPWSRGAMNDRELMIRLYNDGWTQAELAERFGVSWRCVHKWIARWRTDPVFGLCERSRGPLGRPRTTPLQYVDELLALKQQHPRYGPAKLVTFLSSEHRMAASTAGEILKRHGLVRARRRRRGVVRVERSPIIVPASGHTMTADYKGHFRLGNRHYCYPLTIADPASRYIFAIEALASTNGNRARPVFERVFREFGLPEQIVTDNGSPFCAPASLGAISELSKWWIRLGIRPVRIDRGKPQQNAIHERMHRTLKEWTTCPAQRTMPSQQCSFDEFRLEHNTVRPHQSLGQGRPIDSLQHYRRPYPNRLPELEYPADMVVRRVRSNGEIRWCGGFIYLSGVLAGETIGLRLFSDDTYDVYFGAVFIGRLDERRKSVLRIEAVPGRAPQMGEERAQRPEGHSE